MTGGIAALLRLVPETPFLDQRDPQLGYPHNGYLGVKTTATHTTMGKPLKTIENQPMQRIWGTDP